MQKPHLTGESLVLPVATGTVETMFGGSYTTEELQKILLAENTMGRRISDVSEGLCDILTDQLKISHSAIQVNETLCIAVDEVTDVVTAAHIITYIWYVL